VRVPYARCFEAIYFDRAGGDGCCSSAVGVPPEACDDSNRTKFDLSFARLYWPVRPRDIVPERFVSRDVPPHAEESNVRTYPKNNKTKTPADPIKSIARAVFVFFENVSYSVPGERTATIRVAVHGRVRIRSVLYKRFSSIAERIYIYIYFRSV